MVVLARSLPRVLNVLPSLWTGTCMPAPFFWSQAEKNALKEAKDKKLKDARTKHLLDTKDEREAKRSAQVVAAQRQKVVCAKV